MTRTLLNLTTPRFIENWRSFQLSARSFVTKHRDFLQKADVCVCMCCFFFFLFPNWSYWHYLLFCAKIIGMEISLLPLLGCQSWCNWETRFPALRSHVWGIEAQKHLSSLRALYDFFSLFSFSSPEHSTRNFLRVGQKLMCLCQQNPSSQEKTEPVSTLRA